MDARTEELRDAHDVLSEWYAKNLAGMLESMPVERAMLDLFAEMTLTVSAEVADVGCGTGRLIFQGSTPPEGSEPSYGYMLVRRTDPASA